MSEKFFKDVILNDPLETLVPVSMPIAFRFWNIIRSRRDFCRKERATQEVEELNLSWSRVRYDPRIRARND